MSQFYAVFGWLRQGRSDSGSKRCMVARKGVGSETESPTSNDRDGCNTRERARWKYTHWLRTCRPLELPTSTRCRYPRCRRAARLSHLSEPLAAAMGEYQRQQAVGQAAEISWPVQWLSGGEVDNMSAAPPRNCARERARSSARAPAPCSAFEAANSSNTPAAAAAVPSIWSCTPAAAEWLRCRPRRRPSRTHPAPPASPPATTPSLRCQGLEWLAASTRCPASPARP